MEIEADPTCAKAKDQFLQQLHSRPVWRHFDGKRCFSDAMSPEANYLWGVNADLVDQAAFDK